MLGELPEISLEPPRVYHTVLSKGQQAEFPHVEMQVQCIGLYFLGKGTNPRSSARGLWKIFFCNPG